ALSATYGTPASAGGGIGPAGPGAGASRVQAARARARGNSSSVLFMPGAPCGGEHCERAAAADGVAQPVVAVAAGSSSNSAAPSATRYTANAVKRCDWM